MATFLKLCQDTAQESGTVPNQGEPATVENQAGRMNRIIGWVNAAYHEIQVHSPDWRWMKADFEGQTVINVQAYDASALSIASRFSRWLPWDEEGCAQFSIYRTADGQDEEGFLDFCEWGAFRRIYMTGQNASQTGTPSVISINDQNELVLFPKPDAAYTLRGRYRKAPQELTGNDDVPEMPEEFHKAIMWRALMFMGNFDEATEQQPGWSGNFADYLSRLSVHQKPKMSLGGPLA